MASVPSRWCEPRCSTWANRGSPRPGEFPLEPIPTTAAFAPVEIGQRECSPWTGPALWLGLGHSPAWGREDGRPPFLASLIRVVSRPTARCAARHGLLLAPKARPAWSGLVDPAPAVAR